MAFTTSILVRFGDLDPAGIAYYPNLVNFLHVALEDFFAGHVGRPYPEVFQQEGLALPTARVEMDFLSPVRFGDRVEMTVVVEHVGRTSLRMRYEGRVDGRSVFIARSTMVAVGTDGTFTPQPVPDWLRAHLDRARDPGPAGEAAGAAAARHAGSGA